MRLENHAGACGTVGDDQPVNRSDVERPSPSVYLLFPTVVIAPQVKVLHDVGTLAFTAGR